MTTYVALLRGINVSGKNKVAMAELRALVESLGYQHVRTYIQSGNVVFDSSTRSAAKVADTIAGVITRELGLDVTVIVRTAAEIEAVLAANPLLKTGADPKTLHVTFLATAPAAATVRSLADVDRSPDQFSIVGRAVYVHCPDGYGNTKLNNTFFEKRLGVAATTRNWRTVQTLAVLTKESGAKGSLPNLSIKPELPSEP
jgi:uncharacterized protein (DUF1697 family)